MEINSHYSKGLVSVQPVDDSDSEEGLNEVSVAEEPKSESEPWAISASTWHKLVLRSRWLFELVEAEEYALKARVLYAEGDKLIQQPKMLDDLVVRCRRWVAEWRKLDRFVMDPLPQGELKKKWIELRKGDPTAALKLQEDSQLYRAFLIAKRVQEGLATSLRCFYEEIKQIPAVVIEQKKYAQLREVHAKLINATEVCNLMETQLKVLQLIREELTVLTQDELKQKIKEIILLSSAKKEVEKLIIKEPYYLLNRINHDDPIRNCQEKEAQTQLEAIKERYREFETKYEEELDFLDRFSLLNPDKGEVLDFLFGNAEFKSDAFDGDSFITINFNPVFVNLHPFDNPMLSLNRRRILERAKLLGTYGHYLSVNNNLTELSDNIINFNKWLELFVKPEQNLKNIDQYNKRRISFKADLGRLQKAFMNRSMLEVRSIVNFISRFEIENNLQKVSDFAVDQMAKTLYRVIYWQFQQVDKSLKKVDDTIAIWYNFQYSFKDRAHLVVQMHTMEKTKLILEWMKKALLRKDRAQYEYRLKCLQDLAVKRGSAASNLQIDVWQWASDKILEEKGIQLRKEIEDLRSQISQLNTTQLIAARADFSSRSTRGVTGVETLDARDAGRGVEGAEDTEGVLERGAADDGLEGNWNNFSNITGLGTEGLNIESAGPVRGASGWISSTTSRPWRDPVVGP